MLNGASNTMRKREPIKWLADHVSRSPKAILSLLGAAVIFVTSPAFAEDFFANFGRQIEDAVKKGIDDGMRRSLPRSAPQREGSFLNWSSSLHEYRDPGPDTDRHDWNVLVGGAESVAHSKGESGLDLNKVSDTAPAWADRLAATTQWRCFGRPAGLNDLFMSGSVGRNAMTRLSPKVQEQRRQSLIHDINEKIKRLNKSMQADPSDRRIPSPVKGLIEMGQRSAPEGALAVAARIVALNPNSEEAAQFALDLMRRVYERFPEHVTPFAECGLVYLEDRLDTMEDSAVLQRYEELIDRAPIASPVTCAVAASLASAYLNRGEGEKAYSVIERTRRSANLTFPAGDTRALSYPVRDCKFLNWMDGTMTLNGIGTQRSTADALSAFTKCSTHLGVCAYNEALLYVSGAAQVDDPLKPVRLLQFAQRSGSAGLRASATRILDTYFSNGQQVAAQFHPGVLAFMAMTAEMYKQCMADESCRKHSQSVSSTKSGGGGGTENCIETVGFSAGEVAAASVGSAMGGRSQAVCPF